MKKQNVLLLLLTFIFVSINNLEAQIPNLEWLAQIEGTGGGHIAYDITTDNDGNVYTIGRFRDVADFDPGIGTYNLTSAGLSDIFIQKLDMNGEFLWAKQMGGASGGRGYSIAIDSKGDIISTGYFQGIVNFDTVTLVSSLFQECFIQKLDADGNFLWVKQIGGTQNDKGNALVIDAEDNIFVTGDFQDSVDFDPGAGTVFLEAMGGRDNFVLKLDSLGDFVWVKQFTGTINSSCSGTSISLDQNQNLFVTGDFRRQVDFDPGAGVMNLNSPLSGDIFICKLNADGDFLWVKQFGGNEDDYAYSNSVDADGNIVLIGTFQDTVDFDPNAGTLELISNGGDDIFVTKLDSSGNLLWVNQLGGVSNEYAPGLTTDNNGGIYTTGIFQDTVDFDPGINIDSKFSNGSGDIFLQKLSSNGANVWSFTTGANSYDYGTAVHADNSGNVYTIGVFRDTVDFDPSTSVQVLISPANYNIYTQKLNQCTSPFSGIDTIIACNNYTWIDGINYTSSNDSATFITNTTLGCDSIVTLHLTINSVADLSTSLDISNNTITANNSSASYAWLDCDNGFAAIPGEMSASFTAVSNGNYAVELTQNGCVDTSACTNINSVGIKVIMDTDKFNLYPNPSIGKLQIKNSHLIDEIEVFSLDGRMLLSVKTPSESLNLNSLINGIYLVKIESNGEFYSSKLVIQK